MGEHSVRTIRADVRRYLKELEAAGLGALGGTKRRDVFVLDAAHPRAADLSTRAGVQENFIRSEDPSLLFRDAAPTFVNRLDPGLVRRSMSQSDKGLEFRWTQIDKPEIRILFATIREISGA